MSTLNFKSKNEEIKKAMPQIADGKLYIYYFGDLNNEKETTKKMRSFGVIQKLDDVPSAGGGSSDNEMFNTNNALAEMLGVESEFGKGGDNLYRGRPILEKAVVEALEKQVGTGNPIDSMQLYVKYSIKKDYPSQKQAIYKDGTKKTVDGKPVYITQVLAMAGSASHTVLQLDAKPSKMDEVIEAIAEKKQVTADVEAPF